MRTYSPNTLSAEPNLATWRIESELPKVEKLRKEHCAPHFRLLNSEKDEPILKKFLNDNDEPKLTLSRIERELPRRVIP
jgi:hypothetical protein